MQGSVYKKYLYELFAAKSTNVFNGQDCILNTLE